MGSKVRLLSEQTINQIAAGEVIENPASVVKELVENSLDAGATDICIEIKGGGRQLIRVTDNGSGMSYDDALLCLERHATSKIKELEDIHSISTMGFRGEAIPSIASISKFTLLTKTGDSEEGTMVIVDGGRILQCCSVACTSGTTIEVKSLFFNVPVRKKFQKSPAYDQQEIQKMVTLLALGYPKVKFQLICNQKTILNAKPSQDEDWESILAQRIKDLLGIEYFSGLQPITANKKEYSLQGFAGQPSFNRHNRTGQYLFINNRGIFSPLVSYYVKEAYGTSLPTNRYPVFVLHLKMPGEWVDVNVHPQKREVRLRHDELLKELINEAILKGINTADSSPFFHEAISFEPSFSLSYTPLPSLNTPTPALKIEPAEPPAFQPCIADVKVERRDTSEQKNREELFEQLPRNKIRPRILGTIKGYILLDSCSLASPENNNKMRDALALVDQRAAHSRIIFEKMMRSQQEEKAIPMQSLLIPYTIQVDPLEGNILRENLSFLNHIAISIHEICPNSFSIDGIPQFLEKMDLNLFVKEILQDFIKYQDKELFEKEKKRKIALAAGRASISQNFRLSLEEAQSLIDQLLECESPFLCPLGKPTLSAITQEELSEKFQKNS